MAPAPQFAQLRGCTDGHTGALTKRTPSGGHCSICVRRRGDRRNVLRDDRGDAAVHRPSRNAASTGGRRHRIVDATDPYPSTATRPPCRAPGDYGRTRAPPRRAARSLIVSSIAASPTASSSGSRASKSPRPGHQTHLRHRVASHRPKHTTDCWPAAIASERSRRWNVVSLPNGPPSRRSQPRRSTPMSAPGRRPTRASRLCGL